MYLINLSFYILLLVLSNPHTPWPSVDRYNCMFVGAKACVLLSLIVYNKISSVILASFYYKPTRNRAYINIHICMYILVKLNLIFHFDIYSNGFASNTYHHIMLTPLWWKNGAIPYFQPPYDPAPSTSSMSFVISSHANFSLAYLLW